MFNHSNTHPTFGISWFDRARDPSMIGYIRECRWYDHFHWLSGPYVGSILSLWPWIVDSWTSLLASRRLIYRGWSFQVTPNLFRISSCNLSTSLGLNIIHLFCPDTHPSFLCPVIISQSLMVSQIPSQAKISQSPRLAVQWYTSGTQLTWTPNGGNCGKTLPTMVHIG